MQKIVRAECAVMGTTDAITGGIPNVNLSKETGAKNERVHLRPENEDLIMANRVGCGAISGEALPTVEGSRGATHCGACGQMHGSPLGARRRVLAILDPLEAGHV